MFVQREYGFGKMMDDRSRQAALRKSDGETDPAAPGAQVPGRKPLEDLPPAAQRALREAEARRLSKKAAGSEANSGPAEIGGRGGKDPSRFGDWEIDGRAIDF